MERSGHLDNAMTTEPSMAWTLIICYLGGVRSGGCFVALGQRDQLATARVEHGHGDLLQLRGVARVRGPGHCRHPPAHTAHSQVVAAPPQLLFITARDMKPVSMMEIYIFTLKNTM